MPEGSQSYEGNSAGTPLPLLPGVNGVSWTDEWARFLYQSGISVVDFTDPANARFRFAVNARGLTWGGASTTAIRSGRPSTSRASASRSGSPATGASTSTRCSRCCAGGGPARR